MKISVKDFIDKFRIYIGDANKDVPEDFAVVSLNWAFNTLPTVPKLDKAFSKHYTSQLDANGHFRWNLNEDFRCLTDIPMIQFYTSTGGNPCPLKLCQQDNDTFYRLNGLVEAKQKGVPCKFTLEREDDITWLVLDRPSDVPIIIDYIAYGYPKNVKSVTQPKLDKNGREVLDSNGDVIMEDTMIELSAIIETLILKTMREVFYEEAEDLSFAGAALDTISNKYIPEAIQMLNKRWGNQNYAILGEVAS